jgi:hypothetical protein
VEDVLNVVRGIQQDQIEPARNTTAPRQEVAARHSIAALQAADVRVLFYQRCDTAVVFDEGDMRRPATDRFEPEGACARVTVKNMRSRNPRREDVE